MEVILPATHRLETSRVTHMWAPLSKNLFVDSDLIRIWRYWPYSATNASLSTMFCESGKQ
eukprot:3939784-Amphidinium_carterae.1